MTAPPDPPLTDGVVTLRLFCEDDVPAIVEACQDAEIVRWTTVPSPYSEDEARGFVARAREGWAENVSWPFAIVDAGSGELLGSMHVRRVEGNGQIGYWVKREARGRRVATRALRLLSRWAFDTLGFERLQLLTEPDNAASQRVAEGAGFRREAVLARYLELRGRRCDGVMLRLLREEAA